MRRNSLSGNYEVWDDVYGESTQFSRWIMYLSLIALFTLTLYGCWLWFNIGDWKLNLAISFIVSIVTFISLPIIQFYALKHKSENRGGAIPFVYTLFTLFPFLFFSFMGIHALSIHFNFKESVEVEMQCKSVFLNDKVLDFEQKVLSYDGEIMISFFQNEIEELRLISLNLSDHYHFFSSIKSLSDYNNSESKLQDLNERLCKSINATDSQNSCQVGVIYLEKSSITNTLGVSSFDGGVLNAVIIILIILGVMMPIMTSDPNERN
jgi:hypothetical protein